MKRTMIISSMVVLAACGASKNLTQADADRGASRFPGLTLADLSKGKADCEKYCSTCHDLKKPKSETPEAWQKIVPGMAKRAEKQAGKVVIDEQAQQSILKYLITMSGR